MSRPLRIQYPNAVYHIMNRGAGRRPIFLTESDFCNFLAILEQAWQRWQIEVYAYCLMSNHYHLCLKTPEAKLSRVMRHINGIYTQRFNRAHGRDGALFRGRYKALLIEEDEYLSQVVRYIHLNPVKARMVTEPQDHDWNSHRAYLSRRRNAGWLNTNRVGAVFGRTREFHAYVMEGNEKALERWYARKRLPPILGTESFIEEVGPQVRTDKHEHLYADRAFTRPSLERVLTEVANSYQIRVSDLLTSRRGEEHEARKVAIWLVRELCDQRHEQIANHFGLSSGKTVSWACRETLERLETKRRLRSRVNAIKDLFVSRT